MEYEKPIKLGNLHPDIIFFLIGYYKTADSPKQGILSTWRLFMPQVLYAIEKGYVPIIDLQYNYKPMMLDKDNLGKVNAWDLYFKQPQSTYTLSEVLHSKNVIFAKYQGVSLINLENRLPLTKKESELTQKMIMYSMLSDTIINSGSCYLSKYKNKKILGVSFRRCFERLHYFNSELTPPGTHIVRTTLSNLIGLINTAMLDLKYDFFFFTADDRESYDVVKKEFGDKCLFSERPVGHHFINNKPVPPERSDLVGIEFYKRKNDIMKSGIEYMTDVYILSKCDSLLSCGGSVDFFAYILNANKYERIIQPSL